jgi:CheY-like chemotaxis protein
MMVKPVLYAEDDSNDTFLMERSFRKLHIPNPLRIVDDGNRAIAYLSGTPPFTDRQVNPLPCLILLDLKMPIRGGLDVLKWIKSEPSLRTIPVIVFSSSNQESDIKNAHLLGANGFFIKPGDPDVLMNIVKCIQAYGLLEGRPGAGFIDFAITQKIPVN